MASVNYAEKMDLAGRYFSKSKRYGSVVKEALSFLEWGMSLKARLLIESLPNEKQLLEELAEKTKGKPVMKNLKSLKEHKGPEAMVAYSSLLTHCMIEVRDGNTEYQLLANGIYEKLGSLLYEKVVV